MTREETARALEARAREAADNGLYQVSMEHYLVAADLRDELGASLLADRNREAAILMTVTDWATDRWRDRVRWFNIRPVASRGGGRSHRRFRIMLTDDEGLYDERVEVRVDRRGHVTVLEQVRE